MRFEYYVINYDWNKKKVELFNIFNNINIQEWSEQAVKKYLRSPKNFKKYVWNSQDKQDKYIYGWDAFVAEINSILMHELWSRRQYEISVGDAFETDIEKYEKWDCYDQCKNNIQTIAHDIIRQYKEQKKECIN